jgi:hypothetical protein
MRVTGAEFGLQTPAVEEPQPSLRSALLGQGAIAHVHHVSFYGFPHDAGNLENPIGGEGRSQRSAVPAVDGVDHVTDDGHPLDRRLVLLSQKRADPSDGAEKGNGQHQCRNYPAESGTRRGPFEPAESPTPSIDSDGVPSDRAGIERSRG